MRFDREPSESVFGAGFRPSNLGIEWNAENQLKKVLKNAATIATFAYDPFGRRVEKVAGGTTTTFTYDAEDILREIAGATTTYYVHGPGIDEPLAKEISGSLTYYHADGLGSVLKMTNAAGSVTHEYRYDAYGKIEAGSTQGGYSFTSREWDPEIGLHYYRARYYDPTIGRFISEDPIGFAAGPNYYGYVSNSPANRSDPSGLADISVGLDIDFSFGLGIEFGAGLVIDTDAPLQSGFYYSRPPAGKPPINSHGMTYGGSLQVGVCLREMEGMSWNGDLNLGGSGWSGNISRDDQGFNGLAVGRGPGRGGSVSETNTTTWNLGGYIYGIINSMFARGVSGLQ